MGQPRLGYVVAEQLDGKAERARRSQHDPRGRRTHRSGHPKTKATSALAMMGRPAGSHGVTSSAKAIDEPATIRRKLVVSLGQRRPRNAAGTAASSPQAAGFPSALAPTAPTKVKMFQKRKTPIPVNQKPWRTARMPLGALVRATPGASSIVRCAAATRRNPFTRSRGAI